MKYIYYNEQVQLKQYSFNRTSKITNICIRLLALISIVTIGSLALYFEHLYHEAQKWLSPIVSFLSVSQIEVKGNKLLSKEEVMKCAQINYDSQEDTKSEFYNISKYDVWKILANLKSCKQVEKAEVFIKISPSATHLIIELQEKVAHAIWRNQGYFYLLDTKGEIMRNYVTNEEKAKYIILFGDHANKKSVSLLPVLEHIMGQEYSQIASLHLIAQRRWNMLLLNGILIKLPEDDIESALRMVIKILKQQLYLSNNTKVVDLRLLPERIFIK